MADDLLCHDCTQACFDNGTFDSQQAGIKAALTIMNACPYDCGEKFVKANPEYVRRADDGTIEWIRRVPQ